MRDIAADRASRLSYLRQQIEDRRFEVEKDERRGDAEGADNWRESIGFLRVAGHREGFTDEDLGLLPNEIPAPAVQTEPEQSQLPVAEILGALGMTADETVAYLKHRGIKTSLGAVKAWRRGGYDAPQIAVDDLAKLLQVVLAGDTFVLPSGTPETVHRRCEMHRALRRFR